jgi:hypothetical protein
LADVESHESVVFERVDVGVLRILVDVEEGDAVAVGTRMMLIPENRRNGEDGMRQLRRRNDERLARRHWTRRHFGPGASGRGWQRKSDRGYRSLSFESMEPRLMVADLPLRSPERKFCNEDLLLGFDGARGEAIVAFEGAVGIGGEPGISLGIQEKKIIGRVFLFFWRRRRRRGGG